MTRRAGRPGSALPLLLYAAFVVYGSLVPLDFKPYPLAQAWADFQRAPFLHLGVGSRADWVANGVLYAPLALLATRFGLERGASRGAAAALAVVGAALLAVAVEFTQLFFPPRTVSQNDIVAEWLGSVVGALAALVLGGWLGRLGQAWAGLRGRLALRLLEFYAAAYLLLSFFPYDLLLSGDEIAEKAGSGLWAWWLVTGERGRVVTAVQLAAEALLAAPLGALLALRWRQRPAPAALLGAALGVAVELGQFFIASGMSQGVSVLTRAAGVAAGAWLLPRLQPRGLAGVRGLLWQLALPAALLYLPLLLVVNGVFRVPWQGPDDAVASWQALRLLPFYYHYYTTEAVALFSLGSVAVMYLPAAALGWARAWSGRATVAAVAALATGVEAIKLFLAGQHPDPTNVLIAGLAAAGFLRVLRLLDRPAPAPDAAPPAEMTASPRVAGHPAWLALPVLAVVGAALMPAVALPLVALTLGAVVLLWWRPGWTMGVLALAWPLLDLAPWSGRFFVDDYALLFAACCGIALYRSAPAKAALSLPWALLAASLLPSALRPLAALPGLDDNSFSSFTSPWNGLRIGQGAIGAWLLVLVWQRLRGAGANPARALAVGALAGLAGIVAVVAWERAAFASLWDLAAAFRVSGPFSAMHKGGAFVECALAVGSAFAVRLALDRGAGWLRVVAGAACAATGYALMVTYSRNGYAALVAALLLTLPFAWRERGGRGLAAGALVAALVAAVALPVALGPQSRSRLATVEADFAVRTAHWRDGLALRDDSLLTAVLGMGLGRFPDAHYWRSTEPVRAGAYALQRDGAERFLRLGGGATLYLDQIVATPPPGPLTLAVSLRAERGAPAVAFTLCRKWGLTSRDCVGGTAQVAEQPPNLRTVWQRARVVIDAAPLLQHGGAFAPPVKLSLLTPAAGTVDVAGVALVAGDGDELLANGSFAHGMDRWFFSTDVDPPWQLHSLPLTVLFDQGWLGVLAWTLVLATALGRGAVLAWRGQAEVPAALPALAAFLVSGSLNTLIDAPRFLGLLLVLAWLAEQRRVAS